MSQGKDSTACGKGAFSTAQRAEGNDASHRRDNSYRNECFTNKSFSH